MTVQRRPSNEKGAAPRWCTMANNATHRSSSCCECRNGTQRGPSSSVTPQACYWTRTQSIAVRLASSRLGTRNARKVLSRRHYQNSLGFDGREAHDRTREGNCTAQVSLDVDCCEKSGDERHRALVEVLLL